MAVLTIMLCAMAGCASPGKVPVPADSEHPGGASGASPAFDASYDWHVLLLVKFGTLLKESSVPLHEVLLFQDRAQGGDSENKDCFTVDGAPPRFLGRRPGIYLLCFDHDRLNRIEAAVKLPLDEAAGVLARACGSWLKTQAASQPAGRCEGREGDVAFTAHLAAEPDGAATVLSISLVSAAGEPP